MDNLRQVINRLIYNLEELESESESEMEMSGIDESWNSIMRNIISLREHVEMERQEDEFIRELFYELFETTPELEDVKVTLTEEEFKKKVTEKREEDEAKCTICLDIMEKNCITNKLSCNHSFHPNCIKYWLTNYKVTCPVCRMDVRNENLN